MASFATVAAAGTRAKAQVAAGTWINAHSAVTVTGSPCVRFQRPMSPTNPGYGAWVELTDDATD